VSPPLSVMLVTIVTPLMRRTPTMAASVSPA
jgi:hypothetical protein